MFKLANQPSNGPPDKHSRIDQKRKIALPLMANPTLDMLVTHWHLPCWQMACILLGARSNITGRADFISRIRRTKCADQIGKGAYAEPNLRATQIEIFDGLIC